jgi:metalloendopeptidase OMA1, mitochondrial
MLNKCRYHNVVNNPYPLPNDEEEKVRLDLLQYCMSTLTEKNILCPISKRATQICATPSFMILMIVDIGTGSGAWAIEVGDVYTNARVCGIDISPIQNTSVPENVDFFCHDVTNGLADFDTGSTDLVNSR